MIISNRSNGPRYSTDAIAHDVAHFTAGRRSLESATQRAMITDAPESLEALYPSLYATARTNPVVAMLRACKAAVANVGRAIATRRGGRHAASVSASAAAISGRYAPKA